MEKFEVVLTAEDEYSSPRWLIFNSPDDYVGRAHKERGEYSVTILAESSRECRQILDDWFFRGQIYVRE